MCDNLDAKGKRGVPWGSQSLNTVVGSCEPARDKLESNICPLKKKRSRGPPRATYRPSFRKR